MKYFVGIDIGATKIIFLLLANNKIVKKKKIPTPKTKIAFFSALKENLVLETKPIAGVGIGVPALLDIKRELVLNSPNLPYLNNCPLPQLVKGFLFKKSAVAMDNDANCFALAEACLGAGQEAEVVCGITLGSGIGAGIVLNRKIYHGAYGSGGEVGHMSIKFDGYKCSCGSFGCFEEYASEKFFKRRKISSKELEVEASAGDKKALQLFSDYGKYLGIGLANIVNVLDPKIIVLGGGTSKTSKFFMKSTQEECSKRIISPLAKKYVRIKKAKLGEFSGAVGAALLLIKK
ncbi:ROK family protein [Candidatus Parcubacteria bacterium]|nr:ROK family protein [Candidatus Parcubacteria bacterium]